MILAAKPFTPLIVIGGYLALLLAFGLVSKRLLRTSSSDYFVASRSIGPFLLLMSVFGTTMTAFALVGSTGKAFDRGIGVYGLMASASGIIHSAIFFLVVSRPFSSITRAPTSNSTSEASATSSSRAPW